MPATKGAVVGGTKVGLAIVSLVVLAGTVTIVQLGTSETVLPSGTVKPTGSIASRGTVEPTGSIASRGPASQPSAKATATKSPAAPATLVLDCGQPAYLDHYPPGGAEWAIGHSINGVPPVSVRIDYGDGHSDAATGDHLDEAFRHAYRFPGRYSVTATVYDNRDSGAWDDAKATDTCVIEWGITPLTGYIPYLPPVTGGGTVVCADGSTSSSGGKRGACSWHGGVG